MTDIYLIVKEVGEYQCPTYTDIAFIDKDGAARYCLNGKDFSHRKITLYDDYQHYFSNTKEQLIKSALDKLTKQEKEALGLCKKY